ncbi:hypothetical protein A1O7_07963 [Cladophialophora yegresii CBS 114405]|uniref:Ribonuclease H2 subunit B n=1 Tax=Cladophialophora yegresii CBS 114405 TaxID=1182544 RepID=W9WGG9_9EURO|nr:uncharacterized protein A1O7_07963 [Cladophialophora yegresii CBS 114405]EXJ57614.1 hypothetical protein A1O7_07963 [Cladophialophora yegresii CBS 114405]
MAITTRSGSKSPVKKSSSKTNSESPQQDPLKHFILPKDISVRSRFLLLRHPRDSNIQRFLFCSEKGLYQFTKVSPPSTGPRSLLFTPLEPERAESHAADDTDQSEAPSEASLSNQDGYVSKTAEFFVATPFDLAFILLPLVMSRNLFQPIDDLLEEHMRENKHLKYLFEHGRHMVEEAMSRFCDTIQAGDEQMFRTSEDKILRMLIQKGDAAMTRGLPFTLEEKFVTRALEAPILSVKREDTTISAIKTKSNATAPDEENDDENASEVFDSQSSAASIAPSSVFSEVSTTTSVSTLVPETISPELLELQKKRTVLDFLIESYVPDAIGDKLRARLAAKGSPINFTPLDGHLSSLAALRAEALLSRSISDFSRKRGLEDDETAELRAEKKRKQEEEDKRKRLGESNGVRALKKVDVSGMKKMSAFFAKKPAAKVA